MKCFAISCLAGAVFALTPLVSVAASPTETEFVVARPLVYLESLEPAPRSAVSPLPVIAETPAADASPSVPRAPVRTVVPPRPDPNQPNYGVSWVPAMSAEPSPEAVQIQAAPPAVAQPAAVEVSAQVADATDVSIRIVVTVNGEDHVIELPAVTVGQVVQALASAVPTPTPVAPPPSPIALTPAQPPAPPPPVVAPAPPAVTQPAPAPVVAQPPANRNPAVITPRMPAPDGTGVYRVQVGSFARTALARNCFDRLRSAGFDAAAFERFGSMYRVVIPGVSAAEMAEVAQRLGNAGFETAWARREN